MKEEYDVHPPAGRIQRGRGIGPGFAPHPELDLIARSPIDTTEALACEAKAAESRGKQLCLTYSDVVLFGPQENPLAY